MDKAKKEKKDPLNPPKGMHDILPEDFIYYEAVFDKAKEVASYYGFKPIETPHLESIDVFTSTLGETTDIVEKEMYSIKTRSKNQLVMRPEGTASVMRSYISNGMQNRPQPVMLYYQGSFFRYEKPQKGRYREFKQFGLEIINEEKSIAEVVIIKLFSSIIEELGITPLEVRVNSMGDKECRSAYRKELTAYYRKKVNSICTDCQTRLKKNPLRLLDCKEEKCQEIKKKAPQMMAFLCPACRSHFKETLELLDAFGVSYIVDHTLVRGLDYYSRTVFEFFTTGEKPIALCGGGRYDYLAKSLARKDIPACGGALGVDRIVEILKERKIKIKRPKKPKVFFIQIGAAAKLKSIPVIEIFREAGLPIGQSFTKDNLTSQLKIASKLEIPYAIILGQKEALDGTVIIRNMDTRSQETVPLDKLIETIKNKIK